MLFRSLVKAVNSDGTTIATIEGNTGLRSDTDGDGVARKTRRIFDCSFVRWADVTDASVARKAVKIFVHDGKRTIVVDEKTYLLDSLTVNGAAPTEVEIIARYSA